MVVRNTQTKSVVQHKSPVWSVKLNCWRRHRIVVWESQCANVISILVDTISKSEYHEMPDEQIIRVWLGNKVIQLSRTSSLQLRVFFNEPYGTHFGLNHYYFNY